MSYEHCLYVIHVHVHRATHVQNEDGSVVLLSASNPRQRNAIAKRLLTPSKEGSLGGAAKKVRCELSCTGDNYHDACKCILILSSLLRCFIGCVGSIVHL